jgi:hypothetical protein
MIEALRNVSNISIPLFVSIDVFAFFPVFDIRDIFARVLAEEERLAGDREFSDIMKKLKRACDEDKSGRYQRILDQSRESKVFH